MAKLNFQLALLQPSVSRDPSEIILICWFDAQETFLISNVNSSSTVVMRNIFVKTMIIFFSGLFDEHGVQKNSIYIYIYIYILKKVSFNTNKCVSKKYIYIYIYIYIYMLSVVYTYISYWHICLYYTYLCVCVYIYILKSIFQHKQMCQ